MQHEIARLMGENLTLIYSNNESNETVWPGEYFRHFLQKVWAN